MGAPGSLMSQMSEMSFLCSTMLWKSMRGENRDKKNRDFEWSVLYTCMWIDFGDVFSLLYFLFTDFLLSVYLIRVLLLVVFHSEILRYGEKEKNII